MRCSRKARYPALPIPPLLLLPLLLLPLTGCGNSSSTDNSEQLTGIDAAINGYYLHSVESYDSSGALDNTYSFSIDTLTNEMSLVSSDGTVTRVFGYDDAGYLTSTREDLNSGLLFRQAYENGGDGRLLKIISTTSTNGGPIDYSETTEYTYQDNRLRSRISTDSENNDIVTGLFTYDSNGRLSTLTEKRTSAQQTDIPTTQQTDTTTLTYSERRIDSVFDAGADGTVELSRVYLFDDSGNVSSMETFNSSGGLTFKDVFSYKPSPEPLFNFLLFDLSYFP